MSSRSFLEWLIQNVSVNKKAVRADSIPEFLREHKVLDQIAYGFTEQGL